MTMTEDTETVSERPVCLTPSTTIPTSYQGLAMDEEGEDPSASASTMMTTPNHEAARRTLWNFTFMSILFSANHGCVVGKEKKNKEYMIDDVPYSLFLEPIMSSDA